MPVLLYKTTTCLKTEPGLRLEPGLDLSDARPEVKKLKQGTPLRLVFPDGSSLDTTLVTFGVAIQKIGDEYFMPAEPKLCLTINAQGLETVPEGAEIWTVEE